ncbi:PWWP domain [Sesbania bispinosa]|nr:PWWP domain [Sesbania bispinosa]
MGSPGENGIDASVGGLVWVRRRNGSWWPGQIMGLHEVSEDCLVSPRSGTPVKLLGREDASVDWYNLEKSKRVKAFRCGEYDGCIEKAKVSAANSNKKAVKYARREDAILHALELESARLGKEPLNFCSRSDKLGSECGGSAGESPVMSRSGDDNEDVIDDLSDPEDNSNSALEMSQSGIALGEANQNGSSKMQSMQGRRRRTPNDSEDDGTEGVKRMRGLEDLGIAVASKRKVQGAVTPEIVQQGGTLLSNSNTGNCLANGTSVNGGKGHTTTLKRKRSQVANVHEFLKRKNRRRPLTKVLESTAMVSLPVVCDQLPSSSSSPLCGVTNGNASGLDSNGSKKSSPSAIPNSDSTQAACENGTSVNIQDHGCDASQISHTVKENDASGISGLIRNDSCNKLFDVPFARVLGEEKQATGLSPVLALCSSGKPQVGALGQQSCHLSPSEALSLRNEGQNTDCTNSAAGQNIINHRIEKGSSKWQLKGKRNSRHTSKNRKEVSRKHMDMDDASNAYLAGMENSNGFSQGAGQKVDWNNIGAPNASYNCTSQARCKPFAEGLLGGFQDLSTRVRGTTEVKLLPDGSLIPQRSLPYRQSRFTVNSRYQMVDFPGRNYCSDASLYDVKLEVKSSYRPQHVPLVSLVSKLNGKAFIGHPLTVEVLEDGYCDRMLSGIGCDLEGGDTFTYGVVKPNSVSGRIRSKNLSRFSPRKSSKMKKSGLSNKKIRKLSSLTGHKQSEKERKPAVGKLKGPFIACIPLKVVFSRINEAFAAPGFSAMKVEIQFQDFFQCRTGSLKVIFILYSDVGREYLFSKANTEYYKGEGDVIHSDFGSMGGDGGVRRTIAPLLVAMGTISASNGGGFRDNGYGKRFTCGGLGGVVGI